jgi:HlyD family secretion protein
VTRGPSTLARAFSNSSTASDPILTIGDQQVLRVRVDLDESDVSQVRVGQKAYVTADAFGRQNFWGHVVGEQLGHQERSHL